MPGPRLRVDPGDVPVDKAARRLGLTLAEFEQRKLALFDRGFPRPDETTGLYDIEAIDRWRHARNPHLFPELGGGPLTPVRKPRDAREVTSERIAKLAGGR